MIANSNFLDKLDPALKNAVLFVDKFSDFSIKLQNGTPEAMKKAKSGAVKTVLLGVLNASSGGRSDFSSKRIALAINKAMKCQGFPVKIKFKTTAKGHQLYVEKE